ncbi:DEAD/DEAH box helicase [Nocardioides sp. LMS-CY]|uniref:DEAD/DEAH box helicase n=1 Tax=Nocardioides sp. (strain LMS-CY) TaxID=2840457 RepID=UPI0020799651|nr:DEAD/DEAH box helicase [Nocardioides sp. LMS-CY]
MQAEAVGPVLDGRDVVIAAATASGKTEAAWLPVMSALAEARGTNQMAGGVQALYLGPLKALINDQHLRLESLGEYTNVKVHRWHGDVASTQKRTLLRDPSGVLLITPESLEALFVLNGPRVPTVFADLRYVVIDELHSFMGTERGAQLQSLLYRLDLAVRRRVPRIGLSATLADPAIAAEFLRPGRADQVVVLDNPGGESTEIKLQLRAYVRPDPTQAPKSHDEPAPDDDATLEAVYSRDAHDIADHLFRTLRGDDNLVFANSRAVVESYADMLTTKSTEQQVPNEFFPHHGNLSKEYREDVENRLRSSEHRTTAICTSTLEMGIDIGSTDAVAQIGAPGSVAALRQRLGRSGRRDQPAVMRLYISERELTERTPPTDQLRAQLFQTVAMTNLMLHERWYDPPNTSDLHLSTLVQQVLSVIAQHGGAKAADLYTNLCAQGPFNRVDKTMFVELLRDLGAAEVLTQAGDGLLLAGPVGDQLVNHYTFYAAFKTAEEYRLVTRGRTLGSIPVDYPVLPGSLLIFAGRRWAVVDVDTTSRVIELTRSSGGRPPMFSGDGAQVADLVRQRMRALYESDDVPVYLNAPAQDLLDEGRAAYRRLRLQERQLLPWGDDTVVFPWRGDRVLNTVAVLLAARGHHVGIGGGTMTITRATPDDLRATARDLLADPPPDAASLAATVPIKAHDKYDEYLSEPLLCAAYAARNLDLAGARDALRSIADDPEVSDTLDPRLPTSDQTAPTPRQEPRLGLTGFAVIDLETTGFAPHLDDRVVELAVLHADPDGSVTDTWTTLVNPVRDTGPTEVHGIQNSDVESAPTFAELTDWLTERLRNRVLVAHNAEFDLAFLASEYERADIDMPAIPSLCTLHLADHIGLADNGAHDLHSCCVAAGISLTGAHTAAGDATATARLLAHALQVVRRDSRVGFNDLPGFEAAPATAYAPTPPRTRSREPRLRPRT